MAPPNPTGRELVQLGVNARYTGDRAFAPSTNSALQLADALKSLNPELNELVTRYGTQLVEKQKQKAHRDVILASGQRFADAVRSGRIEATQNPFYIQAYNQEAATMSATANLATLQSAAVMWHERNDPVAFQKRWHEEVANLAANYADNSDTAAGFATAESQATQQITSANSAYNVDRIQRARASNMSAMIAQRVGEINRANAGHASPEQIYTGLDDLRAQIIDTGATQEEWDRLVVSGVTSAAYNQSNPALLDVLSYDRGTPEGGASIGPISNRPGVADQLEADRYRIRQASENAARASVEQRAAEVAQAGDALVDQMFSQFGEQINRGTIDPDRLTAAMRASGADERSISYALNSIQRTISDSSSLANAYMERDSSVTSLLTRAHQGTLTEDEIAGAVVDGRIDNNTANQLLTQVEQGGGTNTGSVRNATQLRASLDNLSGLIVVQLQNAGHRVSDQQRRRQAQAVRDAARAYLAQHPGDYSGAVQTAREIAAQQVTAFLQRSPRQGAVVGSTPQTQTQQSGANPRR